VFPLRIGSDDEFAALRQFLSESGYTEQAVCQRLAIPSIYDFKALHDGRAGSRDVADKLDALIRLLMDEEPVELSAVCPFLDAEALRVMADLGLVKALSNDPARLQSEAVLYPQEGLFMASDHAFRKDSSIDGLPEDVVYASITKNTGRFVSILPSDPCDTFLEVCAGTGIAALIAASRYAKQSWACDLSHRATHFAEFNRRLNQIENVCAVQSDLYSAVEGLRFDRIVAHPPYIPATEQKMMFRDGGEDGEQILRGIIQELPRFLNPGGRFYALTIATDREGETFEQRIRQWLSQDSDDFDVFIVLNDAERRPDNFLKAVTEARGKLGDPGPRTKLYDSLKVKTVLYGVVVLERHEKSRTALTARCQKAQKAGSEIVEWFREWQLASAENGFTSRLKASCPHPSPEFRLIVSHCWQDGGLVPIDFRVRCDFPLSSNARAEPWVAILVGTSDGSRTISDLYRQLKNEDVLADDMGEDQFCEVVKQLIGNGFLEIEEFRLPGVEKKRELATAG
jgi:methylase of polypeptide subunit release factors